MQEIVIQKELKARKMKLRERTQHRIIHISQCSGLFCSVVALDVNKIDLKYNKRISKYRRDNDDKNG